MLLAGLVTLLKTEHRRHFFALKFNGWFECDIRWFSMHFGVFFVWRHSIHSRWKLIKCQPNNLEWPSLMSFFFTIHNFSDCFSVNFSYFLFKLHVHWDITKADIKFSQFIVIEIGDNSLHVPKFISINTIHPLMMVL